MDAIITRIQDAATHYLDGLITRDECLIRVKAAYDDALGAISLEPVTKHEPMNAYEPVTGLPD